jgi:hypothetical protein
MSRSLPLVFSLALLAPLLSQSPEPNHDPMRAQLVTSDIPNFWRVFDKASLKDAGDLFQREYIDIGSPGLQAFVRTRIQSGRALAAAVASRPKYYASIREATLSLDQKPEIKQAIQTSFRRMKEIYPDAIFPDVYFVIGRMTSGGTTDGGKGLLLGLEMNARGENSPLDELTSWERAVVGQTANLPHTVAHELIHIEQHHANHAANSAKTSLLHKVLEEGGADFLGEMSSGGILNRVQRDYGNAHEEALWTEFRVAMNGADYSRWLYEGDRAKDRPADMGYYIGFKICEAFYKRSADKSAAIRQILAISDAPAILKESGYGENFAAARQ